MDGVPGLSPTQRKKLLDSKTIHHRGRALFRAVVSKGGVGICPGCTHDKAFAKSWAFGSNSPKVQALQARCNHSHKHQSIAGVKEQGVYLSTLTAEYPLPTRRGKQNRLLPASTATALKLP